MTICLTRIACWTPKATNKHSQYVIRIAFPMQQSVAYPGVLFGGEGFQQIQLRTEDRENGDLGAVLEAAVIWYMKFRFI